MYDSRIKVQPAMYLRWLLHNNNPAPRRNIQYLFNALNNKDIRAIESGIYASIRSSNMPNLSVNSLRNKLINNDKELDTNLSTTLKAVRNSKEYWSKKKTDLHAMDESLGSATWFLTLSTNEWSWDDLKKYLVLRNNDIYAIKSMEINELISFDPLSFSLFWEKRFRAFFTKVLLNENGPLKKIHHYFWRREYQLRGIPHAHIKLWDNDSPRPGKDSDENVIKFINDHISCSIPDPELDPNLHNLVIQFQIHRCTNSCQRVRKNKHGIIIFLFKNYIII